MSRRNNCMAHKITWLYLLRYLCMGPHGAILKVWCDIHIFVNCSWVDTRWQQYSTHLHTNNPQNTTMKQKTQNRTFITIRIRKLTKEYINITRKIHNLQNQTEAYKTCKRIYNDKKNGTKRIWKNVINETAIQATNFIRCMLLQMRSWTACTNTRWMPGNS
jgi:hypothetical protein